MNRLVPLILLTALLAAGCGGLPGPEPGPQPDLHRESRAIPDGPRPASPGESMLMYFGHVRKLPPAELTKEHDTVRQLYAASRSDLNRVRYAILLSVPGTAFNDDARALEALEPVLKSRNAALHDVALLVNAQIQEQRRAHVLQQKLDALMLLEKNLLERDTDGAKRK